MFQKYRKFTFKRRGKMTLKKIILSILFSLLISGQALAGHEVDPFYKSDDAKVSIWGYSNIVGGKDTEFKANIIRIRSTLEYKNWTFFMENDIAGLDERIKANYITQAWAGYNFGKEPLFGNMFSNTIIRAGGLLTAGGLYLPASYETIPVISQHNPFGSYANGAQIQTNIAKDVTLTADITGATGVPYNDANRNSRTETSQRVDWNAIKNDEGKTTLKLSLFNAWSTDFHRLGLRFVASPTERFDIYGGIYRADEHAVGKRASVGTGGFILPEYTLWKMDGNKLDLKVNAMYENMSGPINYNGYSGGLSLELPKEGGYGRFANSSVSADFTHSTTAIDNGPKVNDNVPMVRFRIFF